MIRFQLAGRLGNQLFQWAAALEFTYHYDFVQFTFDNYHQSAPAPLLFEVAKESFGIKRSNFVGRILQINDKFSNDIPVLSRSIHTAENPFAEVTEIPKDTKILRGFYQNWKNISKNESYIFETLDRAISNRFNSSSKLREIREHLGKFDAVHVRQGDYLNSRNGVLSPNYYTALQTRSLNPIVVFTDSYRLDESYINAIKPDFIFSPTEFDAEDTFALMSMSQSIIMANSTFSWWAAFMVSQKGNLAFIPSPWQKEDITKGALLHPKFNILNSKFE